MGGLFLTGGRSGTGQPVLGPVNVIGGLGPGDERIRTGIRLRLTWIVWDRETPAVTLTIDASPDVRIWPSY